uniref:Uncharacterized protein LOC109550204 isoform X1 n=1 Tax=Tursiops truncatus TaxID=9739 RepID=A0A6J3QBX1_TURTR|nr:uncharacterized protein LOC109550204 isoform X1 [Tursiops truncatus]
MMRPLALSERFQVGRERHPDHLGTSSLEDMGGLRRKRDLGQRQKARKVPPAGLSTLLPKGLSIWPGDGLSPGDAQWYPAGQGRHSVRLSAPSAARSMCEYIQVYERKRWDSSPSRGAGCEAHTRGPSQQPRAPSPHCLREKLDIFSLRHSWSPVDKAQDPGCHQQDEPPGRSSEALLHSLWAEEGEDRQQVLSPGVLRAQGPPGPGLGATGLTSCSAAGESRLDLTMNFLRWERNLQRESPRSPLLSPGR